MAPPKIGIVPDPLQPPVAGAPLAEREATAARAAVAAAERGDQPTALRHASRLPAGHPVTLLVDLERRFLGGEDVAARALAFAREAGGYGAAWGLAAMAAERAGRQADALEAAGRAAELLGGRWQAMAETIERALADAELAAVRTMLERGEAAAALEAARELLVRRPGEVAARMLAVRAALGAGDAAAAATLVPALPDTAEGTELKGRAAAALEQWELAAELFDRLPTSHPERCELLEGARERLRAANAPPHVTAALAADSVRRRHVASIVAWQVPAVLAKARGGVPVFEDIVQLAERADIVGVARAGVIAGDMVARRFHPERRIDARELKAIVDRLAEVLGRKAPAWCGEQALARCLSLPAELSGTNVARLVRQVADEEGEPCTRR